MDCSAIERKLGTSLGLARRLSLGLSDKDAAELAEVNEQEVRELRAKLGQVGSSLGLSFKKPVCQNKKTSRSDSPCSLFTCFIVVETD